MLKKLLTTFIVLAATATAWADGWSVTYVTNGCHDATITKSADGTMTLADAIKEVNEENGVQKVIIVAESMTMTEEEVTALGAITQNHVDLSSAKGLTDFTSLPACVKYVILPDGMTKEQVNNVGPRFDAAVSMGAHTKTVWKYNTYNTTGIEYTGVRYNETVVGGIAQATGKVSATVDISNPEILYPGKVFYDKSGKAYQTSDDSKSVQLTAYTERYTYNDNGTTRLYPNSSDFYVVSENGGYVGVQTSSTVTVEKKNVEYTYEKDGVTYEFVYNSYAPNLGKKGNDFYMLEGGSFFGIQTETKWMIDGKSDVYNEENGRLVTNNNIGHVGGTQIPLTKVSAYYVSGTNSVYEGPVRIDGENVYGRRDGGTPVELSVYYYNDNGTEKEAGEGFYVSYDGKRIAPIKGDDWNYNGEWKPAKKEGDSWLVDYGYGNGYQPDGNVTEDKVYKSIDGSSLYVNWGSLKTYNVSKYGYKYDGTSYVGQVYTKDGKYYGYTDGTEIELENRISYTTGGGETYEGAVYTYNNKYFGYDGGNSVELETSEYYYPNGWIHESNKKIITEDDYKSEDGKKVYVGGTKTLLTPYNKEAYVITGSNVSGYSQNTLFTGRVYNETTGLTTGLIGGTETPVTYSAKGYCLYNTDYIIYTGEYITKPVNNIIYGCIDDSVLSPLEAAYQYTYTDPITGETVVYETMEQESSVTVTHNVELTASEESAGKIHLTAYVSIPGSLYYAIGDKRFGGADLTALTLSGSLNAADIASHDGMKLTGNGHAKYKTYPSAGQETDNDPIVPADDNAMPGTYPTFANITLLTYIDFSDAVFNVQTDMQINNMAHSVNGLKTVFLPTNEKMTEIPAHCLWGANGIEEICIPYNYEKIGAEAFYNTSISHYYTTDAAGNIITNGPNTMTFSENLRIIETSNSIEPTFSGAGADKITDVYVMRYNPEDAEYPTTHCQTKAFQASMLCGYQGNAGDMAHPIQRSNYKNNSMWFAVLHYPQDIEEEYEKMYTDITRVYTLKDETGLVDGKGKAYVWPTHGQLRKAYTTIVEKKTNFEETAYDQEFLAKHSGWLEFVLTGKSNTRDYDPQTENTEFVYRDWLAICVPYDLKKSQLLSILGVDPRFSEGGIDEVTTLKNEVITTTTPLYPDVRALTHVSRSVNNGKMILHFAKLVEQDGKSVKCYDVEISKMNGVENEHGQGFTRTELTDDDPVVMKGGHPYLIRAYVPAAWNDKIKNLGMYIMSAASSANHAAMVAGEEEPYKYGACTVQADGGDMYLPCLKHKVHAFDADAGYGTDVTKAIVGEGSSHFVYNTGNDDPALYHFVGTYYDTKIPQYAYYIGKATDGHKFTRSTRPLESAYTWAPYTAVIVGLANPEYKDLNDHAANEKDELKNIVPEVNNGNDLVILAHEAGKYNKQAGARLSLGGFSDSTITGIIDVNIDENVNISNNKVYSINGQYMGTSLNNLPKGIYIINGQKKVVK